MIAKFECLQKVRSRLVVTVEAVRKYIGGVDEIFSSMAAAKALKLRHNRLDLLLNLGFTMTYAGNYGSPTISKTNLLATVIAVCISTYMLRYRDTAQETELQHSLIDFLAWGDYLNIQLQD